MQHFRYPRETVELLDLWVKIGETEITDYTISVVKRGARPGTYAAPTAVGSKLGYMLNGPALGVGKYDGYIRVLRAPESPVRLIFAFEVV